MALDLGLTVTLPEGNIYAGQYTLRLGSCTGFDDLDVRRETGMTVFALFNSIVTETGMGAIVASAIVWLVRRREFPHLTFKDIVDAIPWSSGFVIEDADKVDEDAVGKVPGSAPEPAI